MYTRSMKLDPAHLSELPAHLKTVFTQGKPVDWAAALRRASADTLSSAVSAIMEAAVDKPKTKKVRTLVVKSPFFHHGDLVVTGNLRVVAPFIVTGDVRVSGVMMDCGPDSGVAIGGNIYVGHLHTDGAFTCGNIEAPDGIVYGYYNDHTLECMRIRARIVICDEHDIQPSEIVAKIDFSDIDEYRQGYGAGVTKRLEKVLVDDVFRADEDELDDDGKPVSVLDNRVLFQRLWDGKPVFRTVSKAKKAKKAKKTKTKAKAKR
jgi:hypothetical protein